MDTLAPALFTNSSTFYAPLVELNNVAIRKRLATGALLSPLALSTPVRGITTRVPFSPSSRLPLAFNKIDLSWFYGLYQVTGTVTEFGSNQPLRRKVYLIDETSGQTLKEVWSDATTGAYTFTNIAGGRLYTVISYDYSGVYAAVIADKRTPTLMP